MSKTFKIKSANNTTTSFSSDYIAVPHLTGAEINSVTPSPENGAILYNATADEFQIYYKGQRVEWGSFNILGKDIKLPALTTVQRDALVGMVDGSMIFNTTTNQVEVRQLSAWVGLLTNTLQQDYSFIGNSFGIATPTLPYYNILTRLNLVLGTVTYLDSTILADSYVFVTPTNLGQLNGVLRVTLINGSITITSSDLTDTATLMVNIII